MTATLNYSVMYPEPSSEQMLVSNTATLCCAQNHNRFIVIDFNNFYTPDDCEIQHGTKQGC